jgi:FtsZ-binding cell division protein ZapB
MGFDDLLFLAKGLVKGWNKEKLEKKIQETAIEALDNRIKVAELEEKNRHLEDEIRRLKGEKPKPNIKPTSSKELESPPKKKHEKKSRKDHLQIDEKVEVDVDKDDLPGDAKFIGTRKIVIQDMIIKRNNIEFTINRYWSDELGKVIEGQVPEQFKGSEFGPSLRSFIIYQFYKNRVPHKKIIDMLSDWGIEISKGTVCNILNQRPTFFTEDLQSARNAALKKCSQVHIDETGAKFNGIRAYTFGVSNKFFTSYTTAFEKNRWISVSALLGGSQSYLISKDTIGFIARKLKKPKITNYLSKLRSEKIYSRAELEEMFKDPVFAELGGKQFDIVRTACAVGALRSRIIGSPVKFIISDDAPNFVDLVDHHQLCWVHEIRKYKLCEVFKRIESETLEKLVDQWRTFYKLMKQFKNNQTRELRLKVRSEFERICSIETLVRPLDEQLARTKANKQNLLMFLKYPQLPLHNNMAEIDLRERVIKRKISLQNRSLEGMKAWDLMLSLVSTCRKVGRAFGTI